MANTHINRMLHSLERRLVKERATLMVQEFAGTVVDRWDDLAYQNLHLDHFLRAVGIFRKLEMHVNSLPTGPKAVVYLEKCIREGRPPDERSLISIMAPWSRPR